MEQPQAQEIAREYMRQLGYCENTVSRLQVCYRLKQRNYGRCYIRRKLIILNKEYCLEHTEDTVKQLIAHEVTHFKVHYHNKRFRKILKQINQEAVRDFGSRYGRCVEDKIRYAMSMFEGDSP